MHFSLELLNRLKSYRVYPYKIYNFIFWSYELVLLERLRSGAQHFSMRIENLINVDEHLAFAIIICLQVYVYVTIIGWSFSESRIIKGVTAIICFNIIGLLNEVFQNFIMGRFLLDLIADSKKDIMMNFLGSCLFLFAILFRTIIIKYKKVIYKRPKHG